LSEVCREKVLPRCFVLVGYFSIDHRCPVKERDVGISSTFPDARRCISVAGCPIRDQHTEQSRGDWKDGGEPDVHADIVTTSGQSRLRMMAPALPVSASIGAEPLRVNGVSEFGEADRVSTPQAT